ncbi:MAG: tRNA lysidine(34) synthetase TilS [Clostridia bacterium]|nr:tRNA lysidine(34) synthetase TilS [Clostridia bacterium]
MEINKSLLKRGKTVAVAVSGGKDSMALLHYLFFNADKMGVKVICLNVEHGIRGESSVRDSLFVKSFCKKYGIPLISYAVDSKKKAEEDKLSLEEGARVLRYQCFFDAIDTKKCDYVATAHHRRDNVESVLLNLFRGTGLKGATGIKETYKEKIIRPLLNASKEEIEEYIEKNGIPFVTDETNLVDDYSRNFIRLNVLPKIEEIFPNAESNIARFSEIVKEEDEYLDGVAKKKVVTGDKKAEIILPVDKVILKRAIIFALKTVGVVKDWEKAHIDSVCALVDKDNGAYVNLLDGVSAHREYDRIVFIKREEKTALNIPFAIKEFEFDNKTYKIIRVEKNADYKSGLYLDHDKLPKDAVIRTKEEGDVFTKFGGGTKSLGDYLTDKKVPLRLRESIPLIASGRTVYAIFGVAVSDKVKIDNKTTEVIKLI